MKSKILPISGSFDGAQEFASINGIIESSIRGTLLMALDTERPGKLR